MRVHFKKLLFLIVTACLPLAVAGCAVVKIKDVPKEQAEAVPEGQHTPPMLFTSLKMGLPAGTEVGYVSDFGIDEPLWFVTPANRNLLRRGISRAELELVFSEVMEGQGYDVVDTIDVIFPEDEENEILRTEYRIGGKIIDAKMDMDVESFDNLGTIVFGEEGVRGKLYLKIKWGVYDALRRTTIYQTVTEGTGEIKNANPEGMTLMVNAAFEVAAHNLAASPEFYDLMVHGKEPESWPTPKPQDDRPLKYNPDEIVQLPPKPLSNQPFSKIAEQARKTAVMVQGGAGHGSGFFISDQGHILTNQHVVGNAQRVRVVLADKQDAVPAQVIRVSRPRDVALLKLEEIPEGFNVPTLPIRTDWPAVSEEIYAIGAPKSTRLQDTISKGIVSAHRPEYKLVGQRQDFIQGDVPIHGGNSGGPLLDAHGNIVGLSVIGLFMHPGKRSSDLNLFIPIEDALEKLDIKFDGKRGRSKPALRPQPLHTQTEF